MVIDPLTGQYTTDDKAETNNGDTKTVFYTVVSTLEDFFEIHPQATVYVEGSNQQRTRVYRSLISRHWKQIEPVYQIQGYIDNGLEAFRPERAYEYILITRR